MSSVTESNLEKKFQHVSNTQDSIQSFSLWIIHHKSHCKKIVDVWMNVLRKTKVSHRLTLLYLANDVIQNSKRKGATQFLDIFHGVLPEATVLFRDDQIRGSVERVFNIWETRNIYSAEQIEELKRILNNTEESNDATSKVIAEYKPELLTEKIRKVVKLQLETTSKLSALNGSKLDAANSEVLRQFKDRTHGQQFSRDFEEATRCLEEYIGALEREVAERTETTSLLEQAVIYYDTQRGEAKLVANAYKSFSNRITVQKKKLEGLKSLLPSPFPSPCADAPSPSNSEEGLDLVPETAAAVPMMTDDAPSPVGTPEGLQLSPKSAEIPAAVAAAATVQAVEEEEEMKLSSPIVTSNTPSMPVTTFLGTQAAGLMSSWLDVLNSTMKKSETEPKLIAENKAEDSLDSRLDSRLLNLVQNMPSSVPSALLAGVGGDTPVKDEWASAQGTPVQDEDEPHENDLLKHLSRYSTNSPSQTQWPSALPPNNTTIKIPSPMMEEDDDDEVGQAFKKDNTQTYNKDELENYRQESVNLFDDKTAVDYNDQDSDLYKKEEMPEVRPLLPPPKPTGFFACLGMLSSSASSAIPVSKVNNLTSDARLATQNFPSPVRSNLSSPIGSATPTSTIATTPSGHQGKDDIEPMDMDIGESDDDEDKCTKVDSKHEVKTPVKGRMNVDNNKVQKNAVFQSRDVDNQGFGNMRDDAEEEKQTEVDNVKNNTKPSSYSTYRHYSLNRTPENNILKNTTTESNVQEPTIISDDDDDISEITIIENRRTDNGITDSQSDVGIPAIMENKINDNRLVENRIQENRILDNRLSDNSRMVETHVTEDRMQDIQGINNILTESRVAESRQSENRLADSRTTDERFPESNKASSTWKMDESECLRIQTIQTVRSDDWRSPSWDDGPPSSYNYRSPPEHHHHHQNRFHMQHYDDRRPYERPYNELGYGRGYNNPPMYGGPKRFQAPYGGRGGRGYYVPRY